MDFKRLKKIYLFFIKKKCHLCLTLKLKLIFWPPNSISVFRYHMLKMQGFSSVGTKLTKQTICLSPTVILRLSLNNVITWFLVCIKHRVELARECMRCLRILPVSWWLVLESRILKISIMTRSKLQQKMTFRIPVVVSIILYVLVYFSAITIPPAVFLILLIS